MTTALLALTLTVVPHTVGEIESWLDEWETKVGAGSGDGVALGLELRDFANRHQWYFYPTQNPPKVDTSVDWGMGNDIEKWRHLVSDHFPADQVDKALSVIACESGGDPTAANPRSSASGLFQILASLWAPYFGVSEADLYDPEINVRLAAEVWRLDGWAAWSCA